MALDWRRATRDLREVESNIRTDLQTKGKSRVENLNLVLRSLLEDNAIASIRDIVDSLVSRDPEIAYAAYLDEARRPWAFKSRMDYGLNAGIRESLDDSMSLWSSRTETLQSRPWNSSDGEIIEFAMPVTLQEEKRGVVRLGLETGRMRSALNAARERVWQNRLLTLAVFFGAALSAFFLSLILSRLHSARLTRPVMELSDAAKRMAEGDYHTPVAAQGEGEIALLADIFETLRVKMQAYTQRLESLVAEKVRHIRDLLENVDQGLFTFNPDLTVNGDHSARACSILRLETLEGKSLAEVLRMDSKQTEAFLTWYAIVERDHARWRWEKLSKLAPVQEIVVPDEVGAPRTIAIEYRKIHGPGGNLLRILVLAQDVTEKRAFENRLAEERVRHENRVRAIIGIAGQPEEIIAAFLKDMTLRLEAIEDACKNRPPEWKRLAFFECHTLKGDAGSFGFEGLGSAAQEMEAQLQIADPESPEAPIPLATERALDNLWAEAGKIEEIFRMISGSLQTPQIRLDLKKVERLEQLAQRTGKNRTEEGMDALLAECRSLRYRRFDELTHKYRELVTRGSEKLGKDADFVVTPGDIELDPALVSRIDEALVHIFRNTLAHGIESREIRSLRGKGRGLIEFSYSRSPQAHVFSVRDDGGGIHTDALVKRAVALKLLAQGEIHSLSQEEKLNLIFKPNLSTAAEADSLSGRGQGMAIAWERVREEGGTLKVTSEFGIGTRFTLTLPEAAHRP